MNPATRPEHVIVVGAGIVGVATAVWLQRDGCTVTLIDRKGPAAGTSFGNGGLLARCASIPVTTPALLRRLPFMLFNPQRPLFLKTTYLPKMLPWLCRYLSHANPADNQRISAALWTMIKDSVTDHQALAKGTPAAQWITPSDYLYLYKDRRAFLADGRDWAIRRAQGLTWRELENPTAYDPALGHGLGFAACMGEHGHITDPERYVQDLAAHVVQNGGTLLKAEVEDIVRERRNGQEHAAGVRAGGTTLTAEAVVIATGVWSKALMARLGLQVPMESERGYHIDLWGAKGGPRSPIMVTSKKFVATPMKDRVRLAGIVEFAGLDAPPSEAPPRLLMRQIRAVLPGLRWEDLSSWMGHRPTTADSIPVIGAIPGLHGAYTGFGHHHVGLTGGARTGQWLAQLVCERTPNIDLTPYSPQRFS